MGGVKPGITQWHDVQDADGQTHCKPPVPPYKIFNCFTKHHHLCSSLDSLTSPGTNNNHW